VFTATDEADGTVDGIAFAACPKGTRLAGGGGTVGASGDHLWYSGPSMVEGVWAAAGTQPGTRAFAMCYNPGGSVPGAFSTESR
jgi:hypothetical protein